MKLPSCFSLTEWGIALAASTVFLTIPAVSSVLQNGLVTAKYFELLRWSVVFAVAVTVHLCVRLKRRQPDGRLTVTDGIVVIGICYYVLNTWQIGTADPMRLIFAATLTVWYAGLRILFSSERIFRILSFALLATAGYEAVLGLVQSYGGAGSNHALYAVTGTFYNPGPYGGFLAVCCPVLLYRLWNRHSMSPLLFWISGAVFFTILTVLPMTMSRAAWLAAAIGCGAVCITGAGPAIRTFADRHRTRFRILSTIGIAAVVAAAATLYLWKRDSADGRILIWKNTARMIGIHPLAGCGFGHFAGAYGESQADYFAENRHSVRETFVAGNPDDAFNEYLQIGAEGGIIGGILFLAAVCAGLRGLWRQRETTGGLFFGAVSLLLFAAASYPFSLTEFLLVGVFMLAASGGRQSGLRIDSRLTVILWILVAVPGTAFLYLHERPRKNAYREWRTDHLMYTMKLYEQVAESAAKQYAYLKQEPIFLYEYGHSLHFTGDYRLSNRILAEGIAVSSDPMFRNIMGNNYKASGDYKAAENCYRRAYLTEPNRIYPLYLLARLYRDTGQTRKMEQACEQVLNFNEKITSPATREIKQEVRSWIDEQRTGNRKPS